MFDWCQFFGTRYSQEPVTFHEAAKISFHNASTLHPPSQGDIFLLGATIQNWCSVFFYDSVLRAEARAHKLCITQATFYMATHLAEICG